jgi:hypothetical protein
MVEFDIDGQKFTLVRALTGDEIRRITQAYDSVREENSKSITKEGELTLPQYFMQWHLVIATLQKCFGMSKEEIDNTGINTLKKLFQEVFEYSVKTR